VEFSFDTVFVFKHHVSAAHEELLVFYQAPPPVVDRGMLTRYGRYQGNKIPGADQN